MKAIKYANVEVKYVISARPVLCIENLKKIPKQIKNNSNNNKI